MKNLDKLIPIITAGAGAIASYTLGRNGHTIEQNKIESIERMHKIDTELKKYKIDLKYKNTNEHIVSNVETNKVENSSTLSNVPPSKMDNNPLEAFPGNNSFTDSNSNIQSNILNFDLDTYITSLSTDQLFGFCFLMYNLGMLLSILFI